MYEGLTFDDVQIMPDYSEVLVRDSVDVSTQLTKNYRIKVPIIAAPMDTVCEFEMAYSLATIGAVGVVHRFMPIEKQVRIVNLLYDKLFVESNTAYSTIDKNFVIAAAIGAAKNGSEDPLERARKLLEMGANVLVIDVAHGHHIHVKNMLTELIKMKDEFQFDVIAGSIATMQAAEDLVDWGADGLRVGVGGGSVCETRIRTGIGVPQLQSVIDAVEGTQSRSFWSFTVANNVAPMEEENKKNHIPIPVISDGGIRYPGDAAKALAAGAQSVMIGSLFAGTNESPGETFVAGVWPNTRAMKVYRGLASATTKLKYAGAASHVEGASKMVESRGSVAGIVDDILDGITSAMSYVGASNLEDFRARSRFVKITPAGLAEALPHGLK